LILLIGLIIGLVLGLTGAGGSIFAVPLLVLVLDLPVPIAAGLSLGAVCIASAIGVLIRLRSKQIEWLPAFVFAGVGSLTVPFGGLISNQLNEVILLGSFSLLVAVIAVRLWRQASRLPVEASSVRAQSGVSPLPNQSAVCGADALSIHNFRLSCFLKVSVAAAVTGLLSGVYGVGGGFVIVPVLVSLLRMDIRNAVATSLVVIAIVSAVGFASFSARVEVDPAVLGMLGLGGMGGMLLGLLFSRAIAGPVLQKIFAVLMVILTAVMLLTHFMVTGQ